MRGIPENIFLLPKDAELFGQKYGHPTVKQVYVGDEYVEYVLAAMTDWQPIETAPVDGTIVQLWVPDHNTVTTGWFCKDTGLWPHDEAFSEEGEPCNVGLPTHWMPLPTPPKGDQDA